MQWGSCPPLSASAHPNRVRAHRDVAQFGRAHGWGPCGRRFNSCRPDRWCVGRDGSRRRVATSQIPVRVRGAPPSPQANGSCDRQRRESESDRRADTGLNPVGAHSGLRIVPSALRINIEARDAPRADRAPPEGGTAGNWPDGWIGRTVGLETQPDGRRVMAQFGSARRSGRRGPGFKSRSPDQPKRL